jgi:hypothetical protein
MRIAGTQAVHRQDHEKEREEVMTRWTVVLVAIAALAITTCPAQAKLTTESFEANATSAGAGAHPDVTVTVAGKTALQHTLEEDQGEGSPEHIWLLTTGGTPSDLGVKLPPGLLGDPQAVPQCSPRTFNGGLQFGINGHFGSCPADSQVGVFTAAATFFTSRTKAGNLHGQIYLLSSGPDATARLGFVLNTGAGDVVGAVATASVHESENYRIVLTLHEFTRFFEGHLQAGSFTLWGIPADHNGAAAEGKPRLPFLYYPTDCSQSMALIGFADTFGEPGTFNESTANPGLLEPTGCGLVPFAPSISVEPRPKEHPGEDTARAGAPTGITAELSLPQNESPEGRGTSGLKEAVLKFPPGLVISPSAAAGNLQSCTDEEFALSSDAPSRCPQASLIGEDELESPLLPAPLKGKVYLGQPLNNESESGKMFRIFQEFQGFTIDVKLVGDTRVNGQTGQLEVRAGLTADGQPNIPELPFTHFRVHTRGGPNAVLVNQPTCGPVTTTSVLTPYSNPLEPATPTSTYSTSYDGNGAPCPASLPFAPSGTISSGSTQAGASSPLTAVFSRADGTQPLGYFNVHLPPGLLGYLSTVTPCKAAQAALGECPPASRIGVVSATAGPGPDPLTLPGSIYIARGTGGYPFELSVVVPAVAGPYDLGNVVELVRLQVNSDGSLTAVSDPLRSIVDGVPTDIRTITATFDKPGFIVNPTNCSPHPLNGQFTSLYGTVAPISAPYQVSGCGNLPFKPSFAVATQGATSRARGESLTVRVTQRPGEANLQKVRVELPKALPSRLTTLQKACPEATFYANPAGCNSGSIVGTIVAYTPLLSQPLTGPAYFVSHGGAKFPELIVVLQGEGVTVEVAGETFISKKGITSSTFNAIPDVPVSGFVLTLPEGSGSALAANGAPCRERLMMPTTITGQNGDVIKQSTRIAVTGCPKAKKARVAARRRKAGKTRGAGHRHSGHGRSK